MFTVIFLYCAPLWAQYVPEYLPGLEVTELQEFVTVKGQAPALVFVMGTGVQCSHPQLEGKVDEALSKSFVDSFPCVGDSQGHDGLVSSIIQTVAGRDNVSLVVLKVCLEFSCPVEAAEAAFEYIASLEYEGVAIVNCSFATPHSARLRQAIEALKDKALVVAAAGNKRPEHQVSAVYPAGYSYLINVLAVAALRADDTLLPSSNYGGWVEIASRGDNMCGNGFACSAGTSFAAPVVTGLAVLVYQVPDVFLSPALIRRLVVESGKVNLSLVGRIASPRQANGAETLSLIEKVLSEWEIKPTYSFLQSEGWGTIAVEGNPVQLDGLAVKVFLTSGDQQFELVPRSAVFGSVTLRLDGVPKGSYQMSFEIEGLIKTSTFEVKVE